MAGPIDILIVDDDQNMRATLLEIFLGEGYDVRSAASGEEAVDLCKQHLFRVILMDMRMPGIDGINAFRQIRGHCKRSQIILMSAYGSDALEREALDVGMFAFLPKPLELEAVLKLLTEVMSTTALFVGRVTSDDPGFESAIVAHGFRVSTARDCGEASRMLIQVHFDVVLVDAASLNPRADELANLRSEICDGRLIVVLPATGADGAAPELAHVDGTLRRPLTVDSLLVLLERIKCERIGMPPPQ